METNIEKQLIKFVKKMGGRCIKLNPLWNIGIPDRMILLPRSKIYFIELKDRSKVSKAQKVWIQWLIAAGFDTRVIRGRTEVKIFLKEIEDDANRSSHKDFPAHSTTGPHGEVARGRYQASTRSGDDGTTVRDSSYGSTDRTR